MSPAAKPGMQQPQLQRHERRLGFRPQPAVRWLSPPQLARTGLQVLAAQTIAGYLDNREVQANFPQSLIELSPPEPAEQWIDFVADLGDGFDATYTIATLLAAPRLQVGQPDPADGPLPQPLPRAGLLVMGGDQVYPAASIAAYQDRLIGPYKAASCPDPAVDATLLALPGNHDWYDGLSTFMRVFCQGADIGRWRTRQSRGYFAARLCRFGPQGRNSWWLVGLDSELGSYIDRPQLEYFEREVTARLQPGDAIILCAASPTWTTTAARPRPDPEANNALSYFEDHYLLGRLAADRRTVEPTGAQIRLRLSGDKHHYCRYTQQRPQPGEEPDIHAEQLITCGLGGAYLMGTDQLAQTLVLPPPDSRQAKAGEPTRIYELSAARYPTPQQARGLHRRLLPLWTRHGLDRRNHWFGFALASVHLTLFVFLSTVFAVATGQSFSSNLEPGHLVDGAWLLVFFYLVPPLLINAAKAIARLIRYRRYGPPARHLHPADTANSVMVGLQLALSSVIFLGAVALRVPGPLDGRFQVLLIASGVWVTGYVVGTFLFAVHVYFAPIGEFGKLKMTALAYENGKGFIRMRLDAEGTLTLYPLLAEQVVHRWELQDLPGTLVGSPGSVRPVPAGPTPVPRLIEPPIVISPHGYQPQDGA